MVCRCDNNVMNQANVVILLFGSSGMEKEEEEERVERFIEGRWKR